MNIFKIREETLSLNLESVSLSIDDAKDLFNLDDKDFAKQYLLSKGAKEKKMSEKLEIKPCYLGKAGEQHRKEAINLIKNVIIDDPLRENFKTGYDKAAILLNKNGYRTLKKKRWTQKSVSNFWYHVTVRSKQTNTASEKKIVSHSVGTNQSPDIEMISRILSSNLDPEIKLILVPMFIKKIDLI